MKTHEKRYEEWKRRMVREQDARREEKKLRYIGKGNHEEMEEQRRSKQDDLRRGG